MKKICNSLVVLLLIFSFTLSFGQTEKRGKVKLVLQLTVDQLRGDVIDKYKSSFTEDGFFYLLNHGMNFTNAHYIHSMTKTAPGHATLSTGSTPSKHGIVNNDWFEKKDDVQVYSCEDHNSKILGESDKLGRSPIRLMSPTLGDKIAESNSRSKVFGISVKDRGAILMAGHKGKAFWYSKNSGGFVTSKYYYSDYPNWVQAFNKQKLVDTYYERGWELIYSRDKYQFADKDKNNYEKTLPELGYTFPHKFINMRKKKFYSYLPYSPWGDRLTYEFAKSLITKEDLGKDDAVDYLSISFSCTDYIGHLFGPNTLEYEDQILNLDKTLSDLFHFIDREIGLENVLIILSADHGVCETPEYLIENGVSSGVLSTKKIVQKLNVFGKEKLSLDFDVVKHTVPPYIYLNEKKISLAGLNLTEVEHLLAEEVQKIDGVYRVYCSSDIEAGVLPKDEMSDKVKRAYYKGRSGNLYIINDKYWYMAWNPETRKNAATHGSPWEYDTFVPLIFVGPGISNQVYDTQVGPQDIATTVANYLGIAPPEDSVGKNLIK